MTKKLLPPPLLQNGNRKYVTAVVIMIAVGVLAAILISVLRPAEDNLLLIAAVFGFIAPSTLSLLSIMKAQETHLSVNSRLDAFIKNATGVAKAEGVEQGRSEANARTDKLKEGK